LPIRQIATFAIGVVAIATIFPVAAQNPGAAAADQAEHGQAPPPAQEGAGIFPTRAPGDPVAVARGRTAYQTNCAYCHGDDARGGENGGNNLLRSEHLMKDKNGETLGRYLQSVKDNEHKFTFAAGQVSDVAAFVHSFRVSSRDVGRMRPSTIVVGDARAGEVYFKSHCGSCHSPTGDLKGVASRFADPRTLQQTWLLPVVIGGRGAVAPPSNAPAVTVTVTLASGEKVEGRLGRIDDFIVTAIAADGTSRSFRREGETPKVEVHDPMKPHKDLLAVYTDKDIHDVTAYLVTLK